MKQQQTYKTLLGMMAGLSLLILIFQKIYLLWLLVVLTFGSLASEKVAARIGQVWVQFSELLSRMVLRILLTIIFFCILTPIGVLMRFFNQNKININKNFGKSYYYDRKHEYTASDFEHPW
jgi:hypothetical protein